MDQFDVFGEPESQDNLPNEADVLIHRVFSTDAGKELLEKMAKDLMISPTVEPGMDQFTAGINEGYKQFMRNILLTIERVEGNNE